MWTLFAIPGVALFNWRCAIAKRFTDSRKWDDPWFTGLDSRDQLAWIYLLDKCDHYGIYKPNISLINFQLKTKYSKEKLLQTFKERVVCIKPDKWFIPKYIKFQYGNTEHSEGRMIKSVHTYLDDNDLLQHLNRVSTECTGSVNTPMCMDMDMDKRKDKDKRKKELYKEYIYLYKEEYNKLIEGLGKEHTEALVTDLNNYIGSKGKKYKSHYHTILVWASKDKGPKLTQTQINNLESLKNLGDDE